MDADVMTYLGMTLDTAPRAFGWGHLANWVRHLPPDAATVRWAVREHERSRAATALDGRHFGSDPIPISDFDEWYYGGE